jgi:hypothetical protein
METPNKKLPKQLKLFIGPCLIFFAAGLSFLAASGGIKVPLASYILLLERRDLVGLAAFFAIAGGVFVVMNVFYLVWFKKHGTLMTNRRYSVQTGLSLVVICSLAVAMWPGPMLRLSFYPSDDLRMAGYRFYTKGSRTSSNDFATRSDYPAFLIHSNAQPNTLYTCNVSSDRCFTNFCWTRFVTPTFESANHIGQPDFSLSSDEAVIAPERKTYSIAAQDLASFCKPNIDLSSVTQDPKAQALLMPYSYNDVVQFDYSEITAAEGNASDLIDYHDISELARYLMFLRTPDIANQMTELRDNSPRGMSYSQGYQANDHVYAIYACDLNYAKFLYDNQAALLPLNRNHITNLIAKPEPVTNAQNQQNINPPLGNPQETVVRYYGPLEQYSRVDPFEVIEMGAIAFIKKPTSPECQKVFQFYESRLSQANPI